MLPLSLSLHRILCLSFSLSFSLPLAPWPRTMHPTNDCLIARIIICVRSFHSPDKEEKEGEKKRKKGTLTELLLSFFLLSCSCLQSLESVHSASAFSVGKGDVNNGSTGSVSEMMFIDQVTLLSLFFFSLSLLVCAFHSQHTTSHQFTYFSRASTLNLTSNFYFVPFSFFHFACTFSSLKRLLSLSFSFSHEFSEDRSKGRSLRFSLSLCPSLWAAVYRIPLSWLENASLRHSQSNCFSLSARSQLSLADSHPLDRLAENWPGLTLQKDPSEATAGPPSRS